MNERSVDVIYNRYLAEERLKHGTKYERLAAIVFKVLDESSYVVQDIRLRGEGKETSHQIDVHVSWDGRDEHLVIECRDLAPHNKLGLGDLRDFFGVIHPLQAHGLMLTTTGFTRNAKSYARDHKIALGVLRPFIDADWNGRVREVQIEMTAVIPVNPRTHLSIDPDPANVARANAAEIGRIALWNAWAVESGAPEPTLHHLVHRLPPSRNPGPGEWSQRFQPPLVLVPPSGQHVVVNAMTVSYDDLDRHIDVIKVGGGHLIAELLLRTLDDRINRVFTSQDLTGWQFGPGGEVTWV
jgi:hypothetical protein